MPPPAIGQPGHWDSHWGPPLATSDETVKPEEFEDSFEVEAEVELIRATVTELIFKTTL